MSLRPVVPCFVPRLVTCFAAALWSCSIAGCGKLPILPPDDFSTGTKSDQSVPLDFATLSDLSVALDLNTGDLAFTIPDAGAICGPDNCADGCCDASHHCQVGTTTALCGKGGAACTACTMGQTCPSGTCTSNCTTQSCPNGCCDSNNVCQPGTAGTACGAGGLACTPCTANQSCSLGACRAAACNGDTCPSGCCDGNHVCQAGTQPSICGTSGNSCTSCAMGQFCIGGVCGTNVCNAQKCPNGCCQGNVCVDPPSAKSCGANGAACGSCSSLGADTCQSGACLCGQNAPCGANLHCVSGQCVCDSTSCANGCCRSNVCTAPVFNSCGGNGAACTACGSDSDGCTAGQCSCGMAARCPSQQRCVSGKCVCDEITCPNGCCDLNGLCQPGTTLQICGQQGTTCASCNAAISNACINGACMCGGAPACVGGKSCKSGQCI